MVLDLILGVILGIAHYLSELICTIFSKHRDFFISFVAGVSISYLFLELFPSLYISDVGVRNLVFLFVLLGFFLFHLFEKSIYMYSKTSLIAKELTNLHSFGFFVYHFVIGVVLVSFLKVGLKPALLFFIPVFMYSLIGDVSLNEIHSKIKSKWYLKLVLALSTLLGIVVAKFFGFTQAVEAFLLGFVAGALVYVVVRDSIPRYREGNLLAFASGVILYSFLIFLLRII